jgi:hypothetical protein
MMVLIIVVLKVMGPGGMLESLKINGSINIDFDVKMIQIYQQKIFFYFRKCFIFNEAIFRTKRRFIYTEKR